MTRRQFIKMAGLLVVLLLLDGWRMLLRAIAEPEPQPTAGWGVPWSVPWSIGEDTTEQYYFPAVWAKVRNGR
jgi:hypothetical protein